MDKVQAPRKFRVFSLRHRIPCIKLPKRIFCAFILQLRGSPKKPVFGDPFVALRLIVPRRCFTLVRIAARSDFRIREFQISIKPRGSDRAFSVVLWTRLCPLILRVGPNCSFGAARCWTSAVCSPLTRSSSKYHESVLLPLLANSLFSSDCFIRLGDLRM